MAKTDEHFTPPDVYEAVKDWACARYGIGPDKIVRPFWPGGDYENYDYPPDAVVLDNPPFSIITKICRFYLERGIPFFLFAPGPQLVNVAPEAAISRIVVGCSVKYESRASIGTGFVTSYDSDIVIQTAPDLREALLAAQGKRKTMRTTVWPQNVTSAGLLEKYAIAGIRLELETNECTKMPNRPTRENQVFGGGLLLSDRAADRLRSLTNYELTERQQLVIDQLNRQDP